VSCFVHGKTTSRYDSPHVMQYLASSEHPRPYSTQDARRGSRRADSCEISEFEDWKIKRARSSFSERMDVNAVVELRQVGMDGDQADQSATLIYCPNLLYLIAVVGAVDDVVGLSATDYCLPAHRVANSVTVPQVGAVGPPQVLETYSELVGVGGVAHPSYRLGTIEVVAEIGILRIGHRGATVDASIVPVAVDLVVLGVLYAAAS
jgi:hypothetical protein